MKHIYLLIIIFFITCNISYSTEQYPDILIIGNDTIKLKTFPLEELNFIIRPFQEGNIIKGSSACRRGYRATWKVIDNKLFLIEMIDIFGDRKKLNLIEYFKINNFIPKLINGLIYADWYSAELVKYDRGLDYYNYLTKSKVKNNSNIIIIFENGILIENYYNCQKETNK